MFWLRIAFQPFITRGWDFADEIMGTFGKAFGEFLSEAFKSHIFGDHLILEFEQALYVAIHLMKKMYTAIVMDPKTGKPEMDPKSGRWVTYTKGLCSAKRDGSKIQRDILTDIKLSRMTG